MEFKYRAVDDRSPPPLRPPPPPPPYFAPHPAVSYFAEQTFRARYGRSDPRQNPELAGYEMMQREIEKQKIREELIARRRELEAEVRMEMMMEREMALRGGSPAVAAAAGVSGAVSFEEKLIMRLGSRFCSSFGSVVNQFNCLDDHRIRMGFSGCGGGGYGVWPPVPRLSEASPQPLALMPPESSPANEDSKDKLIVLDIAADKERFFMQVMATPVLQAKPDPNHYEAKLKTATPPEGGISELPFAGLKMRPTEEWSCALCQVSATSERGLNEHLQGKKHKAKEAALKAQKMALLPKRTAKRPKVNNSSTAGPEVESKRKGEAVVVNRSCNESEKKIDYKEEVINKNDTVSMQKDERAEALKKNDRLMASDTDESTLESGKKRKFRFWCEICQVGAYSSIVMENHKNGRKHQARHRAVDEKSEVVTNICAMEPLEASGAMTSTQNVVNSVGKAEKDAAEADGVGSSPENIAAGANPSPSVQVNDKGIDLAGYVPTVLTPEVGL